MQGRTVVLVFPALPCITRSFFLADWTMYSLPLRQKKERYLNRERYALLNYHASFK